MRFTTVKNLAYGLISLVSADSKYNPDNYGYVDFNEILKNTKLVLEDAFDDMITTNPVYPSKDETILRIMRETIKSVV